MDYTNHFCSISKLCTLLQQVDFVDIDLKLSILPLNLKTNICKKKANYLNITNSFRWSVLDMEKIKYLSKKYHFKIIEDASHALGGK